MSRAGILLLAVLCAPNLEAQTVVRPEAPLDSARASLREALFVLRDSLSSIDAAAGRLQRDYRQASAAALLSRARVMTDACARSRRTIPPTKEAVLAADGSNELRRQRQRELVQALERLAAALSRCEVDFGAMSKPGQGERVRGYGNDRAARVQTAIRQYERLAGAFLAAHGIKVRPRRADPSPVAG